MLLVLAPLAWSGLVGVGPDYDRWDDFEYHTPMILEAHSQWLAGAVPFWNRHQFLGEPLLAAGQPAALYLPYTVLVAGLRLLGLPDTALTTGIVVTHLPVGALGAFLLLRALGVSPLLALLGAVQALTCGYLALYGAVWIFLVPLFAWLPWALLGVLGVLREDPGRGPALRLAVGLGAIGLIGHPQFTAYAWLTVAAFGLALGLGAERPRGALRRLGLPLLAAACLAAPAVLPTLDLLPASARAAPFSRSEFGHGGMPPAGLAGVFTPVARPPRGQRPGHATLLASMGPWVPLALSAVLFLPGPISRRAPAETGRLVLAGAVLLLLSLGAAGGLYPWTHGIPLWSSFRWPHKLVPFGQFLLVLAGTTSLERVSGLGTAERGARRLGAGLTLAAMAGVLLARGAVDLGTPSGVLSLGAGLVTVLAMALPWGPAGRGLLLGSGILGACGLVGLAQGKDMRRYPERHRHLGATELGVDPDQYVLPVSDSSWVARAGATVQSLALFQSATRGGYLSATGVPTALLPRHHLDLLPVRMDGSLPRARLEELLRGDLLPDLGVSGWIVHEADLGWRTRLEASPHHTLRARREGARIYQDSRARPLVRFEPPGAGAVVRSVRFEDGGRVVVELEAPAGGTLVVCHSWYPQWRARVDERPVPILRYRDLVQAIEIPPGARRVVLAWRSRGLDVGLALAVLGALALWLHGRGVAREP